MKTHRTFSLLLTIALLGIDQLSKYLLYNQELWASTPFLQPLFNTGISRGIAMPMRITLAISLVCVLLFSYLFQKTYFTLWEFSLFIAWTLWNLIDRLRLGGVRDFIALGNFPVFNFADAFLTIAVILLLIRQIFPCKRKEKV